MMQLFAARLRNLLSPEHPGASGGAGHSGYSTVLYGPCCMKLIGKFSVRVVEF